MWQAYIEVAKWKKNHQHNTHLFITIQNNNNETNADFIIKAENLKKEKNILMFKMDNPCFLLQYSIFQPSKKLTWQ